MIGGNNLYEAKLNDIFVTKGKKLIKYIRVHEDGKWIFEKFWTHMQTRYNTAIEYKP
jgi:hypothetical protein